MNSKWINNPNIITKIIKLFKEDKGNSQDLQFKIILKYVTLKARETKEKIVEKLDFKTKNFLTNQDIIWKYHNS